MNKFMEKIFKSSLFNSIALIILGLLLTFQSEVTIVSISYVIAAVIIMVGVVAGLRYIKNFKEDTRSELDVIYSVVCIVLGIVVIKNPQAIASIIPFVIGIVIIINSATKLQYSMELKENQNNLWKSTMILALITTVCGIILIFNPFSGAILITRIVGILILIYSVLDIISTISIRSTVKQLHEAVEETITDAEIIDDKTNKKRKKSTKKNKKEKK